MKRLRFCATELEDGRSGRYHRFGRCRLFDLREHQSICIVAAEALRLIERA